MDSICILLQLILSFHIFYKAQGSFQGIVLVLGSVVVHLILYLMMRLRSQGGLKCFLYVLDIMLLAGAAFFVNSGFWIMAAAVNAEFTSRYKQEVMLLTTSVLLVFLIILQPGLIIEQGTLLVLVIIVLGTLSKYEEKINGFKKTNEQLRDKLNKANRKIEYVQKEVSQIEEATKIQERNILVQKLHDKIGHTLAANIMQLEAAKIILHTSQEDALKMLEGTIQNLRSGMDDIRGTLREIKPEQSELGINQIKYILDELSRNSLVETEFSFEGDLSAISLNVWHVIAQNLRETVTNLLKYSKADRLRVKIEVFHKIIKVQFKDNGEPQAYFEKGLGLMGIEERTQSINGRLVINTNEGFETLMIINRGEIK